MLLHNLKTAHKGEAYLGRSRVTINQLINTLVSRLPVFRREEPTASALPDFGVTISSIEQHSLLGDLEMPELVIHD